MPRAAPEVQPARGFRRHALGRGRQHMGCVGEASRGRLWPSGRCCSMALTRGRSSSGALPWLAAQIRNVSPFADVPHWGPTAAQPCTPPPRGFRERGGLPSSTPSPAAGVAHGRACAPLAFSVPVECLTLAPCQHQNTRVARSRGCISCRDGGAELILTVRVAVGLYGARVQGRTILLRVRRPLQHGFICGASARSS